MGGSWSRTTLARSHKRCQLMDLYAVLQYGVFLLIVTALVYPSEDISRESSGGTAPGLIPGCVPWNACSIGSQGLMHTTRWTGKSMPVHSWCSVLLVPSSSMLSCVS